VNDAMVSVFSPVVEMTPEEYRRVTEVNYLGTVHGTLAALRYMAPAGEGVILQIGSALVYRSIPLQSAYCASKAAIRGFTDSLRCELLHDKSAVKVCMLQLPAVNTPQFDVVRTRLPRHPQPVPPIFQPEVIARAALHLAMHPRREMWVGWSAAKAIIGQKFIGGLLDRYLARAGWDSQMDDRPVDPIERKDNLASPLPGDRGAHGDFDARAKPASLELWARLNAGKVAACGAAAAALALVALRGLRA
jgi:NAD(P)-dependent dehydrogenase (short-subunit alcohol dehydrogenase family)